MNQDGLGGGWVIPGGGQASRLPPVWETLLNRLVSSLIWVPFLAVASWLFGWLLRAQPGVGRVLLIAVVTATVSSVLVTLAERPTVVRSQNPRPGGWGHAIWLFVLPPLVGCAVGWWLAPTMTVASGLAAAVVFGATGWLTKPWRKQLSKDDFQANWRETERWLRGGAR